MAKYLTGLVPADLSPDAVNISLVGELIIDRAAVDKDGNRVPTAYIALPNKNDPNKRDIVLLAGAGKYELIEHLARAHVIGNITPTNYDKSTIWYNTELMYVEPTDATKAFISVRVEDTPGNWVWKKVLPYTSFTNVIIGKDDTGAPITLDSLIKEGRISMSLPTRVREASYGELYLNDRNELYYKMGPNPEDQHLVGVLEQYLRDRTLELITVNQTPPTNFNYNSVWFTEDGDVALSRTKYMNFVDASKSTGLKFVRDAQGQMKAGAFLENESKALRIDNNSSADYGHVWTNMAYATDGKYYSEFYIEDTHNKGLILLLGDGKTQPSDLTYGTEVDGTSVYIGTDKNKFKNVITNKAFPMNKKTIFIMVEKVAAICNVKLGYVTDSGDLQYVYGTDTTAGFTLPLARIAVGALAAGEPNSVTRFQVRPYLVKKIPAGYLGLNNSLPGENPWLNYAIATNAQSVHLGNNTWFSNFVDSGRIFVTLRDYTERHNAKVGEIIANTDTARVYMKKTDQSIVPIAGIYDDQIYDHLMNSVKVTGDNVQTLRKITTDPSRIYVNKGVIPYTDSTKIIEGNLTVIDNSTQGDGETYKIVLPNTKTPLINHTWTENATPKSGDLKTYLDALDNSVRNILDKDTIYSGYADLRFTNSDLLNTYSTYTSFIKEASKRMLPDSLYVQTVTKIETGTTSTNQIDNFFKVPESGTIEFYRDEKGNVFGTLKGEKNTYTKNFLSPNFINNANWKKIVEDADGSVLLTNNITGPGTATFKSLVGGTDTTTPLLKLTTVSGKITADSTNLTDNSANLLQFGGSSVRDDAYYTIGDKKFKSSKIISSGRPVWEDANGVSYPWLTTQDIRNGWNFRGDLYSGGTFVDLNTLNADTNIGYYNIGSTTISGFNYPDTNILVGKIHNYGDMQVAFGHKADGGRVYIRTKTAGVYGNWSTLANEADMVNKLNISGGTITGNLVVNNNLTANNLGANTIGTDVIQTLFSGALGGRYNVMTASKSGPNNVLTFGDRNINNFILSSIGARPLYNNGTKTQNILVQDDLDTLNNNLSGNYYTKTEMDGFLLHKSSTQQLTDGLNGKVSKDGDSMSGKLTMVNGGIEIQRADLTLLTAAKFNLAGRRFETVQEYTSEQLSTFVNTVRYDMVKIDTSNERAVFTIASPKGYAVNTNSPSAIQINVAKSGEVSINTILNQTLRSTARTIVMRDEIDNAYAGTANFVTSATKGKELKESTIGFDKGALSATLGTGSTYAVTNFTGLDAGIYRVTTANEKKLLGLDENIVKSNNGIFHVEGNKSATTRSYRYVTLANDSTNKFVLGIYTTSGGAGAWKYLYDITSYYTREEIDGLLTTLETKITNKFRSSKFKYTGHSVNNSIPKKLVHTHNHESLGDSDTLYFKTNLSATKAEDNKNFSIYLEGFSMGSAGDNISIAFETILTGRVELSGGTTSLKNLNIITTTPGTSIKIENVKITSDGFLTYSVRDTETNRMLSFDTYMRFSSISDTTFDGEITLYQTTAIN